MFPVECYIRVSDPIPTHKSIDLLYPHYWPDIRLDICPEELDICQYTDFTKIIDYIDKSYYFYNNPFI